MEHPKAAPATLDGPIEVVGRDGTSGGLVQDMIVVFTGISAPLYAHRGFHDRPLQAVTVGKRDPAAPCTVQAYRFALDPTRAQQKLLAGHCHAARTAFNVMLAAVKANRDQRAAERSYGLGEADLTPALNWPGTRCGGSGTSGSGRSRRGGPSTPKRHTLRGART